MVSLCKKQDLTWKIKTKVNKAGGVAQVVEHLLVCMALSSNPRTTPTPFHINMWCKGSNEHKSSKSLARQSQLPIYVLFAPPCASQSWEQG
jgi:hypothetical protein